MLPRRRGPDVAPLVADESPEVLVASQVVDDVHGVLGELSAPKPRHKPDQTKLDGQAGEPEGHELQQAADQVKGGCLQLCFLLVLADSGKGDIAINDWIISGSYLGTERMLIIYNKDFPLVLF